MNTSSIEGCSALVHKFPNNICSINNSSELKSPTHKDNEIKNEEEERKEEEEEERKNEMFRSSDISSTSNKEQIQTKMGNKILQTKSKITNFKELTQSQIDLLLSSTNFSEQQIREWHQS